MQTSLMFISFDLCLYNVSNMFNLKAPMKCTHKASHEEAKQVKANSGSKRSILNNDERPKCHECQLQPKRIEADRSYVPIDHQSDTRFQSMFDEA